MTDTGEPVPAFGLSSSAREKSRESIFLGAQLLYEGAKAPVDTRVRNISSGGMMVDATIIYAKGHRVTATIKGIGEIGGVVAWSTENRIGIAFDELVDPKLTRQQIHGTGTAATYKRPYVPDRRPGLAIR
jgi:hypothetical protein